MNKTLTSEQQAALDTFVRFMSHTDGPAAMILRGAAGTGKTTLAAAVVSLMRREERKMVLMAPTGRAAKVFSLYAEEPAFTIHRCIYRQKSADADAAFQLNYNRARDTLFIVDEASMINTAAAQTLFGSGNLLDDLFEYVYAGPGCRLLLIGDAAQLPPVGQEISPALDATVVGGYVSAVYEARLDTVLRQSLASGILTAATEVRQMIDGGEAAHIPEIRFRGFGDIHPLPGNELIEQLSSSYNRAGIDETIVITRSNKRAGIYNRGIRNMVLGQEDILSSGDMLLVVKNNYYWASRPEAGGFLPEEGDTSGQGRAPQLAFIANGDRLRVRRVRNIRELYGFQFADVTAELPDYDDRELTATVLLDTLSTDAPALTADRQQALYEAVMADYADIPRKSDRLKKLKEDPYYNALQIKFAYAVTCHKAQGGSWEHVYVDQGYLTDDMINADYLHWLYTAFTRATRQLYLVNWRGASRS